MYALKFISGKYQGGEFPLAPNKQVVIGRSSDLDMVLVEDMVSRKHAKIVCHDGKIVIEDLGSTNGTFVNGEKVRQARLKEGDRILIGTSILKLAAQSSIPAIDSELVKQRLKEVAEASAARDTRSSSSMTGKLEEVPLPDLLQLFSTSKKNGVLCIKGQHQGRIYIRQGQIYYAVIDEHHELDPHKSFFRIVRWEQGSFELLPPDNQSFLVELGEPTEALLMEGLRQHDELRRIEQELPSTATSISLALPLSPPLRGLSREELDLIQLVHNERSIQAVLDKSHGTDLDTSTALLTLLRRGYLRVN